MATIIRIKKKQGEELHEQAKKTCKNVKKLMRLLEEYVSIEDDDEEYNERDDDDDDYDGDNDAIMNKRKRVSQATGRYGKNRYGDRN